jgi:hypothetical protein
MEVIKRKLKDIEHMVPYKFHFDFGFHNLVKETYQHKSHYYDERPSDVDYKHEGYEIYDYMTYKNSVFIQYKHASTSTFKNKFVQGYMESEKWRLFPTLELIVKYSHIIFQDGRKYIVGKGAGRIEITDLISLFRFLQTTKNYAIFNNLLNVMLIFIIDYNAEILSTELINKLINEHYRMLYRINPENNSVILVNSFIYEIEKKEVDYYSVTFNEKARVYLASNWDKCFDDLAFFYFSDIQKQKSLSSVDKESNLEITKLKKQLEELIYNMNIGHKLILSLQYQYIMDNIDVYSTRISDIQSILGIDMKLIYTHDKNMNMINNVFVKTKLGNGSMPLLDEELDEELDEDEMNKEIQKVLLSWMRTKYFELTFSVDRKKAAKIAFDNYVKAKDNKQKEDAYSKYAEIVATDTPFMFGAIMNVGALRPYSTNYARFDRMEQYKERKRNEQTTRDARELSRLTQGHMRGGGIEVLLISLIVAAFVSRIRYKIRRDYEGSIIYIYPTLSAIYAEVAKKRVVKELNIHSINILYSYIKKILYISYVSVNKSSQYNQVVVVSSSGTTISSNKFKIEPKTSPPLVIRIGQVILFSNKHILKELYLKIKTLVLPSKVSSPKVLSPKVLSPKVLSKSSSSFGSLGSPPKGGKAKKKK